jgi:hypothetical protein
MKTDHLVEKNEMIKNHIVDMHEMVCINKPEGK